MSATAAFPSPSFTPGIRADVVGDSRSTAGHRVTTMSLQYPRYIHAEVMTHRVFSRNAGSSRAVPVSKLVDRAIDHPVVPDEFGSNQRGMQAGDPIPEDLADAARSIWLTAREACVDAAASLAELGVHKQHANRLLEPFSYIQVVVTATDWDGFFAQRISPLAQPEIRDLAVAMKDALDSSHATTLPLGDWHTPFIRPEEDHAYWNEVAATYGAKYGLETNDDARMAVSVARCARVSYLTHEGVKDVEADLDLYRRLRSAEPPHASPFEHVCRTLETHKPQRGNLRGFEQLRHLLFPTW